MIVERARMTTKLPAGAVLERELHRRWQVMRRRCYDPDFNVYRYYGGKGIEICPEWRTDFLAFQKWALGHGWRPGLTIDRKDSTKGYSPANCRWTTMEEQAKNRPGFNVEITVRGKTQFLSEWADELGVSRSTLTSRITVLGWDPVKAVTYPVKDVSGSKVTVGRRSNTIYGWAKELGIPRARLYWWIKTGLSPEQAVRKAKKEKRNGL